MKKYIRTKDKVCEITEWQCDLSGEMFLVKADNKFGNDKVFAEDIIAEADTIEELCDYVFLYDSQNELVIIDLKKTNLYCLKGSLKDGSIRDVKLAILTDKGLIYVAKMNEKGELELI